MSNQENLEICLVMVARQLGLDPKAIVECAAEDDQKGFYDGGGPFAIPYTDDGKFLYALIRMLHPKRVLEIGTAQGGSARHILEALDKNRDGGTLTCIDIDSTSHIGGIPAWLRKNAVLIHGDAEWVLKDRIALKSPFEFDFIHEDGAHSIHLTQAIYTLLPDIMPKGGVILSHDVSTGVGPDVITGINKAGFDTPPLYQVGDSPCGFSVMKYEGV